MVPPFEDVSSGGKTMVSSRALAVPGSSSAACPSDNDGAEVVGAAKACSDLQVGILAG
jgi:hypothetical protein